VIRSPAPRGCTAPQPVDAQLVRPFAGWLVHAAAAAGHVGTMSAVSGAGRSALSSVNPAAYEPMPPALYVYRQSTPHGQHTGIVCDVTPEAFLDGRVLGHESVQPERVEGLARYLATMPQHVELVSMLHRAGPVVRATLALVPDLPPDRDVVAPDGTRHAVWCIPRGPQTDELCRELGAVTHYVADGHHRVAASLEVWARSGRDSRRGVLCVAYPLDGLRLAAIDRRVPGPVDAGLVRSLLAASFVVRPVADAREALSAGVAMNLDRRWYAATYAGERPAGSAGLDVSLLHSHVLDRLPAGTVVEPTRDSVEHSLVACDADGGVLFALPAPELTTLIAIADAREAVPAKSTYFSPKPGSGIFLRAPAGRRRGSGRTAKLRLPS
jgi:uncharacterized protein (DUF1015 family)